MNFLETAQDLQTLAKVCGHNNKKKKKRNTGTAPKKWEHGKILPESSKFQNQKNCGIIGEELPGSDAQGMMYFCDGPCTSSGLKASDLACRPSKEKETIALASWKAKLNVIEIWLLTVAYGRVFNTKEKI